VKISGFTIVKNAILLDYPLVESILSILPIVDEYVVLIGKSDDDTLEMVKAIGSPKIKIIENEWIDRQKKGGEFFSTLTNLALAECAGDWAFYLQADEVIHEKDLPRLKQILMDNFDNTKIKAISLEMRNFHGDYQTWNPYSHRRAVRIIRNNGELESIGDAVTFRLKSSRERNAIQHIQPESVLKIPDVFIFHYSWVKDKRKLVQKENLMSFHYFGDNAHQVSEHRLECYYIKFKGSHPNVMQKRIAEFQSPFPPYRNRWLNPKFYLHLFRHGYKGPHIHFPW
jgi:glycosyltransferase involved in cell wall biosynthesis